MTYTIATLQDIPTIRALAQKIWPPTYAAILQPEQLSYMMEMMYSTDALATQINDGTYTYLLFTEAGQPAGFAAFSAQEEAGIYKLHKIYLDTTLQGKGLGRDMMHTVKQLVTSKGAHTLELDVNRYNKALHFYERLGFIIYKEKDTHIGEGYYMNDYVMRIRLDT
ncbi:Acetyltransferase (GNAT) domain-containing protein [Chitinophaga costaii]|uniref:Acetyltransferase (GNAT) domain-containing protein n=1 Tax=Chitinophaga costaii TaxID=1335309 RepID=A0A1C3Z481_9BACT|nr:GNAT family N-acetyltransferase [Chitinophaga costaii]PUZ30223.1 N-acetyltransferase [Chitinophaga costaii]SCB77145.1 Acetyltransferase (GNAT) domain-containing protein [Chitinophaga costaii]